MAFDPMKYQTSGTPERCMPVVLLLDVSGSMSGDKIDNLYEATVKMIETFVEEGKRKFHSSWQSSPSVTLWNAIRGIRMSRICRTYPAFRQAV